ncbi:MAG TPA: hypothetical protein PLV77_01270, partial [Solirubrobacterales bacterium]|nr:hypothetical protein [Solirubrobacterales bacterium]
VGQPNLVRGFSGEPVPDPSMPILKRQKIVVNGRAGFPGLPLLLRVGSLDSAYLAKTMNPILASNDPFVLQLVFEEPVTKRRIILVEVNQLVDDLGIVPVPI